MNTGDAMILRTTSLESESFLSRLQSFVDNIDNQSRFEALSDDFSRYFVPVIVFLAFFAGIGDFFLLDFSFSQSVLSAITVLTIACPCAIGLAAPVTFVRASSLASRRNLLVK